MAAAPTLQPPVVRGWRLALIRRGAAAHGARLRVHVDDALRVVVHTVWSVADRRGSMSMLTTSERKDTPDIVAVVDDDPTLCDAIGRMLASRGYRVAGFTAARDYLAERSRELLPSCLLADIRMPDVDGLELYRRTKREGIEVPTIFMTGAADVSLVVDAMKTGAADVLPKPFSAQRLYAAVEAAMQRARRVSDERWSVVRLWAAASRLTPREAQVAGLVASGLMNKQVALEIGTGEKTVKVHRARAMRKLGAHSLADLVRVTDRLLAIPVRRVILPDGSEVRRPPAIDRMAEALSWTKAPYP